MGGVRCIEVVRRYGFAIFSNETAGEFEVDECIISNICGSHVAMRFGAGTANKDDICEDKCIFYPDKLESVRSLFNLSKKKKNSKRTSRLEPSYLHNQINPTQNQSINQS